MKVDTNNLTNKYADVPLRVKTWIYIIIIFALAISHPITMKLFISFIGFQVFFEFSKMFQVKINSIIITSLFVGLVQFCLLNFENYLLYSLGFSTALLFVFLIKKNSLKQISGIATGLILVFFIFPYLAFLREETEGIHALIFLVVVTEFNDVFQYLMGKSFGKHKILPKISPNKTWEGFVGGVLLTVFLSNILGYFLLSSTILIHTFLGIILGISGFFGDIFMSFLKRKANVKDTGKLLPGHGGLLDRMDSLIFNTPIFFWCFHYF